jgi:hypothetical protein
MFNSREMSESEVNQNGDGRGGPATAVKRPRRQPAKEPVADETPIGRDQAGEDAGDDDRDGAGLAPTQPVRPDVTGAQPDPFGRAPATPAMPPNSPLGALERTRKRKENLTAAARHSATSSAPGPIKGIGPTETAYDYRAPDGRLLFQVVRHEPKAFRQRRPDPDNPGGWVYDLDGVERVLYRLPELRAAAPDERVFVVEGEKDADRLSEEGLVATCNPMGAGKWRGAHSPELAGRHVVVVPDNDEPGRDHAEVVARSVARRAASVRVLELPDLEEKGDVTDFLDDRPVEDLVRLARDAPLWVPPTSGQTPKPEPPPLVPRSQDHAEDAPEADGASVVELGNQPVTAPSPGTTETDDVPNDAVKEEADPLEPGGCPSSGSEPARSDDGSLLTAAEGVALDQAGRHCEAPEGEGSREAGQHGGLPARTYEIHPLAELFPPMRETEFARLRESVRAQGRLIEPITLLDDQVLDGRHRHRACQESGVAPTFRNFDGPGTPLDYVLARNGHRRHLD